MMDGRFKEYNWRDIQRLIYKDSGLNTNEQQRAYGEFWNVGGFQPPENEQGTCVRVNVYAKPFGERIKDHAGREASK